MLTLRFFQCFPCSYLALVGTTKVYPGIGADIVMESISLYLESRLELSRLDTFRASPSKPN